MFQSDQKVLVLNPQKSRMFMADGFHLIYPEKPYAILPAHYEPTKKVKLAIESGTLIDYNKNVLLEEGAPRVKRQAAAPAPAPVAPAPVAPPAEPVADPTPVAADAEGTAAADETPKAPAKGKKAE